MLLVGMLNQNYFFNTVNTFSFSFFKRRKKLSIIVIHYQFTLFSLIIQIESARKQARNLGSKLKPWVSGYLRLVEV